MSEVYTVATFIPPDPPTDLGKKSIAVAISMEFRELPGAESIINGLEKSQPELSEKERIKGVCEYILANYDDGALIVADQLQAWNLAFIKGLTVSEAESQLDDLRQEAQQLGSTLVSRIQPYIDEAIAEYNAKNQTSKQIRIIRWGEILAHPEFQTKTAEFLSQYCYSGTDIETAVMRAAFRFCKSHHKPDEKIPNDSPRLLLSQKLIREEASVVDFMMRRTQPDSLPTFAVLGYSQGPINGAVTAALEAIRESSTALARFVTLKVTKVVQKLKSKAEDNERSSAATTRPVTHLRKRKDEKEKEKKTYNYSSFNITLRQVKEDLKTLRKELAEVASTDPNALYPIEFRRKVVDHLLDLFNIAWPKYASRFPSKINIPLKSNNGAGSPPLNSALPEDRLLEKSRETFLLKLDRIVRNFETNWASATADNNIPDSHLLRLRAALEFMQSFAFFFKALTDTDFKLNESPLIKPEETDQAVPPFSLGNLQLADEDSSIGSSSSGNAPSASSDSDSDEDETAKQTRSALKISYGIGPRR